MKPLISVMIGVYNAEPYIGEAIESVLAQTYGSFELIVVDDGSDDGSAEVIARYPRAKYIRQSNAGNGSARNRAVEAATGELFAFLDADDRFTPGKLERQVNALESDRELDMVFGHVREFVSPELDEEMRGSIRAPFPEPMPWASPSLMLIRRPAFERVGLFSTVIRVGVTVDWLARAREAGLRQLVLPDIVLERRLHLQNNGLRERDSRSQYLQVLRDAMDRRRAVAASQEESASEPQAPQGPVV